MGRIQAGARRLATPALRACFAPEVWARLDAQKASFLWKETQHASHAHQDLSAQLNQQYQGLVQQGRCVQAQSASPHSVPWDITLKQGTATVLFVQSASSALPPFWFHQGVRMAHSHLNGKQNALLVLQGFSAIRRLAIFKTTF